jgi:3-hydroxybutyryl-CoA dehydratase
MMLLNYGKMKKVDIKDIYIGMSASISRIITDIDVVRFADISGDLNPIHIDDEYAKKSRYKKRIAHGLLSASLFSSLFGTELPGDGCVYVSQSLVFKRPVYIGDVVTANIVVEQIDVSRSRLLFITQCAVSGKIVIDGKAEIFIP